MVPEVEKLSSRDPLFRNGSSTVGDCVFLSFVLKLEVPFLG